MSESNWYIYYSGRSSFKNYANDLIRKFNPSIPKEDIMGSDGKDYKMCIMDIDTGEYVEVGAPVSITDWFKPIVKNLSNDSPKADDIHKPSRYLASNGSEVKDLIAKATEELHGEIAFYTGCMIKYACRWGKAGGKKDLAKIVEYAHILLDLITKDPSILTWSHEDNSKEENDVIDACHPWSRDFAISSKLSLEQSVFAIRILYASASWWVRGNSFDGFCCAQKLVDIITNCNELIETL